MRKGPGRIQGGCLASLLHGNHPPANQNLGLSISSPEESRKISSAEESRKIALQEDSRLNFLVGRLGQEYVHQ